MARDTGNEGAGRRADGAAASRRRSRSAREGSSPARHSALGERYIAGRPARIMRPRLVFIACLTALLAFGLLMVYSASSVEALKTYGDSLYFLKRQALWIALGLLLFALSARIPLGVWHSDLIWVVWGVILALLVVVLVAGQGSRGATRWIPVGPLTLQPSEFAKAVLILLAARIFSAHYEEGATSTAQFIKQLAICLIVPLVLIILQPDFGTCAIIVATVYMMCFMAGFSYRLLVGILVAVGVLAVILVVMQPYRMERFMADPWDDPYDTGFQATVAMMAFASGGLFGRGIGNSTMKYNYLPEAHNDYILAIIGEELGFVGTVVFFAVFLALVLAGLKIAMRSPTLQGRLVASGCSCILMVQFFVNALGILSVTPMTGKPLPFISYGGSSIWASLILAGLIMRVSLESNVETEHDARRSSLAVADESTAGEAQPRSARVSRGGFSVYEGGASAGASGAGYMPLPRPRVRTRSSEAPAGGMRGDPSRRSSGRGTRDASGTRSRSGSGSRAGGSSAASSWRGRAGGSSGGAGGWERVDLGPSAHDRLRGGGSSRRYNGGDGGSARGGSRPRSPRRDG